MTDQPKSIGSLKKLAAAYPSSEKLDDLIEEASKDPNHRAGTLAIVSLLEGALKELLIAKLIIHEKEGAKDLFSSTAPLRALSAKIKIGFALGLYGPETREDLHIIREIRNAFAHTMTPMAFDSREISNVCKRIRFFERMGQMESYPMDWADLRIKFMMSVSYLTLAFDSMAQAPELPSPTPDLLETESLRDAILRAIAR